MFRSEQSDKCLKCASADEDIATLETLYDIKHFDYQDVLDQELVAQLLRRWPLLRELAVEADIQNQI